MRSDEIVKSVRFSAFIGDAAAFTEYTDARVLIECNHKLQTAFEDIVVKARAGYWLHEFIYTTVGGDSDYRIPPRSVVGGLEKVEVATSSAGPFSKLTEVPVALAQDYRGSLSGNAVPFPFVYCINGDVVDLIPTPQAGTLLKLTYYIRPSQLQTSQSSTQGGDGVDRGRITVVNTGARTVTVNALPFDQSLTVPAAITSATQTLDVIHPDGWHELSYVGATQTIAGNVITFTDTQDMTDILVGDYVRVADQTDWPCLPDDFHRCLADAAAVKILLEQNMQEKAQGIGENNGNDLTRFKSLLLPRVKADPKTIGILRRSRGGAWPAWRVT
jgi:hypothetical protein